MEWCLESLAGDGIPRPRSIIATAKRYAQAPETVYALAWHP